MNAVRASIIWTEVESLEGDKLWKKVCHVQTQAATIDSKNRPRYGLNDTVLDARYAILALSFQTRLVLYESYSTAAQANAVPNQSNSKS